MKPRIAAAMGSAILLLVSASTAGAQECLPNCRSGFVCIQGQCVSACNPPCPTGLVCTGEGSCVAEGSQTAPSAPSPSPFAPRPAAPPAAQPAPAPAPPAQASSPYGSTSTSAYGGWGSTATTSTEPAPTTTTTTTVTASTTPAYGTGYGASTSNGYGQGTWDASATIEPRGIGVPLAFTIMGAGLLLVGGALFAAVPWPDDDYGEEGWYWGWGQYTGVTFMAIGTIFFLSALPVLVYRIMQRNRWRDLQRQQQQYGEVELTLSPMLSAGPGGQHVGLGLQAAF